MMEACVYQQNEGKHFLAKCFGSFSRCQSYLNISLKEMKLFVNGKARKETLNVNISIFMRECHCFKCKKNTSQIGV